MNVIDLFPIPVCEKYLEPLSKSVLDNVHKLEKKSKNKNTYVLEEKFFKNLKKEINSFVQQYVDEILKPSTNIEFYITQSWLKLHR